MADLTESSRFLRAVKPNRRIDGKGMTYVKSWGARLSRGPVKYWSQCMRSSCRDDLDLCGNLLQRQFPQSNQWRTELGKEELINDGYEYGVRETSRLTLTC